MRAVVAPWLRSDGPEFEPRPWQVADGPLNLQTAQLYKKYYQCKLLWIRTSAKCGKCYPFLPDVELIFLEHTHNQSNQITEYTSSSPVE